MQKVGEEQSSPTLQLSFRLDCGVIVSIGAGRGFPQHLRLRYLTDKQHMAAQIGGAYHLRREKCVGIFRDIFYPVCRADILRAILEFIHFPARLHPKVTNHLKRHLFGQHRDVKSTRFLDDFTGKIVLLTGDRYSGRIIRHLKSGIDDTAIVTLVSCREHKQPIGQLEQRGRVDLRFLFRISESSGSANLQKPFHGEPRRVPSRGRYHGSHQDSAPSRA